MGDVRGLVRMHAECSPQSINRRFLSPMPGLSTPRAVHLLCPPGGFSLVVERLGAIAGILTAAAGEPSVGDVGLLVAARWQRQGLGNSLLVAAVREATRAGFVALSLSVHPDNSAVLPLVNHAGLRARVSWEDGVTEVRVPLVSASCQHAADRRAAGRA